MNTHVYLIIGLVLVLGIMSLLAIFLGIAYLSRCRKCGSWNTGLIEPRYGGWGTRICHKCGNTEHINIGTPGA